jgi:integrase
VTYESRRHFVAVFRCAHRLILSRYGIMAVKPKPYSSTTKPHLKWVVSFTDSAGKRHRRYFRTKREAAVCAGGIENDLREAGRRAASLPPQEKAQAAEAVELLRPYGIGILELAQQYVAQRSAEEGLQNLPVGELVEQFLDGMRSSNLRPRSIESLHELRRFASVVGNDRPVARIAEEDCRSFIFEAGASPRTSTNRRLRLGRFFRWALKQGHVLVNPVEGIEPPRNEKPRPAILGVGEAQRLMHAAAELAGGKWQAYVAVTLFCGLRPEAEAERLDWSDVNLAERTIVVRSGKLRARRVVEIPENAIQWLAGVAKRSGPVAPQKMRSSTTMQDVREHAGIREWQPDTLRHTALSYRLALLGDEARVASWAGNSPTVLHAHYKAITTREEAERFFAITPDASGELIRFGSAGEAEAQA